MKLLFIGLLLLWSWRVGAQTAMPLEALFALDTLSEEALKTYLTAHGYTLVQPFRESSASISARRERLLYSKRI